jgi:ribosome-associated protein
MPSSTLPDTPESTHINTEYIELDKLLKRENLVGSGGEARYLISQGEVLVNGEVETRKRRKVYTGDVVRYNGVTMVVAREAGFDMPADAPEKAIIPS